MSTWRHYARVAHKHAWLRKDADGFIEAAWITPQEALWAIVCVLGLFCFGLFCLNCYRHLIGS